MRVKVPMFAGLKELVGTAASRRSLRSLPIRDRSHQGDRPYLEEGDVGQRRGLAGGSPRRGVETVQDAEGRSGSSRTFSKQRLQ